MHNKEIVFSDPSCFSGDGSGEGSGYGSEYKDGTGSGDNYFSGAGHLDFCGRGSGYITGYFCTYGCVCSYGDSPGNKLYTGNLAFSGDNK